MGHTKTYLVQIRTCLFRYPLTIVFSVHYMDSQVSYPFYAVSRCISRFSLPSNSLPFMDYNDISYSFPKYWMNKQLQSQLTIIFILLPTKQKWVKHNDDYHYNYYNYHNRLQQNYWSNLKKWWTIFDIATWYQLS